MIDNNARSSSTPILLKNNLRQGNKIPGLQDGSGVDGLCPDTLSEKSKVGDALLLPTFMRKICTNSIANFLILHQPKKSIQFH